MRLHLNTLTAGRQAANQVNPGSTLTADDRSATVAAARESYSAMAGKTIEFESSARCAAA